MAASRERRLALGFMVVKEWGEGKGSHAWERGCMIEISHWHPRKEHLDFLISWPTCGTEGEEGEVRLENC